MPQSDPAVLAAKVEAQLLRAARPALRRLAKASRGKGDFRSDVELRACLGLARAAATLLRRPPRNNDESRLLQSILKGGFAMNAAQPASQNVSQGPTLIGENTPQTADVDQLTDRQRAALELILAGQNESAIARQLGVDRRTIYRWRHDDEHFARELHRRRRQLWDGVVDRVRALLEPSVEVLCEHLNDSLDRNRYRAAVTLPLLHHVPLRQDRLKLLQPSGLGRRGGGLLDLHLH